MISYSVEILFNSEGDKQKLLSLLEVEQAVWNSCSQLVFEKKPPLELKAVHKLVYYDLRGMHQEAPSQVVIKCIKDVISTYRTIKSNKHNITKPPIKTNLSVRLDKRLHILKEDKSVRITTLEKRIEVSMLLYPKIVELFAKHSVGDPLLYKKGDKFLLSFPFETVEKTLILQPLATGIDLGINNLATTSEGIIYKDKTYLKSKRELRYLKRKLSSKGTKSSRRHLKKVRRKERNKTKNYIHNLTKRLILESKGNVLVLENLSKIKTNTKRNKEFNNKHSQIPYYLIKEILTYKAPLYGKKVVTVNPSYTSQIDSRTGLKNGKRDKGRYMTKDGKQLHSDINASINIASRSKLPISVSFETIYGQGVVNHPIVCKPSLRSITSS